MSITNYMNLDLPVPGPNGTQGPDYASKLVTALTKIDEHNHSDGNGAKIPTSALNINADLDLAGFNAINARTVRLANLGANPPLTSDKCCFAVVGGDLYYFNGSGAGIKITSGTGINLSSLGTIGGDFSTSAATVTYSDTSKSYLFKQDSTKTGDLAFGSMFFYENVAGAKFNKIQSATSLSTDLTFTWFSALPVSTLPVVVSSSGAFSTQQIATAQVADLAIDANKLKSDGSTDSNRAVTTNHIRDAAVTTAKVADGAITQQKLGSNIKLKASTDSSSFFTTSTSYSTVTNQSVGPITASGRAILVGIEGNQIRIDGTTGGGWSMSLKFQYSTDNSSWSDLGVASDLSTFVNASGASSTQDFYVPNKLHFFDSPTATVTYYFRLQAKSGSGSTSQVSINGVKIWAVEL